MRSLADRLPLPQLNVVGAGAALVVVEGIVEDREDALRRDRVGRVTLSSPCGLTPPWYMADPDGTGTGGAAFYIYHELRHRRRPLGP